MSALWGGPHVQFARVVGVRPDLRRVDLVFMDDGRRASNVMVLSGVAAASGGEWHVPSIKTPLSNSTGDQPGQGSRLIAACMFTRHGRPVVIGWAQASGSQMIFTQQDRSVTRHDASGTYTTTAPDGSHEICTGAAYIRIGNGTHEPLAQFSAGGAWQDPPATTHQITIATAQAAVTISPSGEIDVTAKVTVRVTAPSIVAAGPDGNAEPLVLGNFESKFNAHTHNGGPPPDQKMTAENLTTNLTAS